MSLPGRSQAAAAALLLAAGAALPQEERPGPRQESPAAESTMEPAPAAAGERVREGTRFPAPAVSVLKPGAIETSTLDLATEIGVKPVVFFYFLLGDSISEEILQETGRFVKGEASGKVVLHPVVRLGKRYEVTELAERMNLLGIDATVVLDEDGRLQAALGARLAPHVALVDAGGILCFTGASSLSQPIQQPVDVREAIRMAARGEEPPVVFKLFPYHPVEDLVGSRFRDFTLPAFSSGGAVRLADHVQAGRMTALLYWSPRDAFSRKVMPGVVIAHRTFGERYLDLISIVRLGGGVDRAAVEAYAKEAGIAFPVLEDRGRRFTSLYRVTSTPTLILIRPEGVVDHVNTSGLDNYYTVLQARIQAVLQKPAAPPASPASPGPPANTAGRP